MKKVTLIGDSIRLGYLDEVRKQLRAEAEVWSPELNCMHSVHHLFNLSWYVDQPADVIHFNCGLWDSRRLSKDREEFSVPVELYLRNIEYIIEKTREASEDGVHYTPEGCEALGRKVASEIRKFL